MTPLFLSLLLSISAPAKFDDAALRSRLEESAKDKTNLLIYTWSPQMPISVRGLSELFASKGRRNYRVLALLDEGANLKEAGKLVKEKGWPAAFLERNESLELRKQGARVHHPSYIFVKDGRYAKPLVPGYREPAELARLTAEAF
jgi:hypothetical protein